MSSYRVFWPCCENESITESYEPEECPFCELLRYRKALNNIASWDEGAIVDGSFDEPASAKMARKALYGENA